MSEMIDVSLFLASPPLKKNPSFSQDSPCRRVIPSGAALCWPEKAPRCGRVAATTFSRRNDFTFFFFFPYGSDKKTRIHSFNKNGIHANETKLRVTCGDDRTTERDTHLLHMSPPPNHISIFLLIRIRHVVPRDNYYENHSNILMYEIRAPLFMWWTSLVIN